MPPASHRAALIPADDLCIHPPATPPPTSKKMLAIRLFRFGFLLSGAINNGSLNKSQYRLVSTFVGTSFTPSTLLMTICPPNWKASIANGIRLKALFVRSPRNDSSSSVNVVGSVFMPNDGTARLCARAAAMKTKHAWRMKDNESVNFRRGWKYRALEKKKQPAQNAAMETRARSQRRGWLAGRRAAPRARKMVLPEHD